MINSQADVLGLNVSPERLASATHEEILSGATTDVYFVKTRDVLRKMGRLDVPVTAEIFSRRTGIFAGMGELLELLKNSSVEVEAVPEGQPFASKEVLVRIRGSYGEFGIFETAMLGVLASSSGWATAARECVKAAGDRPVLSFGARHVHPAVASVMDCVAIKAGGCVGGSSVLGAKLAGLEPSGTIPHAAVLLAGDTLELAHVYISVFPDENHTFLVDTFHDEAEETLRLAEVLGKEIDSVRLDTPGERGGVTPDLVREIRFRLDMAGHSHVRIVVSGGLTPDRIPLLRDAGADVFGVGSYISHADALDMTMDIKEIEGKPIAKRGRLPGVLANSRLVRVK